MNLNNKKIIALLMTIVAFTSILNLEYYSYYDKGVLHDESNINEYYISQEIINMLEQKSKRENKVQPNKYYYKVIYNYFI